MLAAPLFPAVGVEIVAGTVVIVGEVTDADAGDDPTLLVATTVIGAVMFDANPVIVKGEVGPVAVWYV